MEELSWFDYPQKWCFLGILKGQRVSIAFPLSKAHLLITMVGISVSLLFWGEQLLKFFRCYLFRVASLLPAIVLFSLSMVSKLEYSHYLRMAWSWNIWSLNYVKCCLCQNNLKLSYPHLMAWGWSISHQSIVKWDNIAKYLTITVPWPFSARRNFPPLE